jgi:hypothetical protein
MGSPGHGKRLAGPPGNGRSSQAITIQVSSEELQTLRLLEQYGSVVSLEDLKMLELLKQRGIGLARLQKLIRLQEDKDINVNAPAVMPFASDFQINGGNFIAGQTQHILSTGGRSGGSSIQGTNEGLLQTHTQTHSEMTLHANNPTNQPPRAQHYSRRALEGRNTHAPPAAVQLAHGGTPQHSRNPYWNALSEPRGTHNQMSPFSDAGRQGISRPVNIMGPSVMAGASDFAFGEGVSMEAGAMAAVNTQIIYQDSGE